MHASQGASTCDPGTQQHRQDHVWQGNHCNRSCTHSQVMQPTFTTTSQEKSAHGQLNVCLLSAVLLATHRDQVIRWSGTSACDFWCILAGPWRLSLHPPCHFCLNSLVKMRQFLGFICSEQSRCGGLQSKHVLDSCQLSFITAFSVCQMHSDVAPGRVHPPFKCRDEFHRPSLSKTPEIWFQWWLARCHWMLQHMWLFLSQSRVWEHWFRNYRSILPQVMIKLWCCFTVKPGTILPHFHISGWARAHSVSQSWIYGKCRLTV